MILNLDNKFTDPHNSYDPALENFINKMEIQILGCGSRVNDNQLHDYMFSSFLLIYLQKGSTRIQSNNSSQVTLHPGSMYIFTPFEIFTTGGVEHQDGEKPEYLYFYFNILPLSSTIIFQQFLRTAGEELYQQPWFQKAGSLLESVCRLAAIDNASNNFLIQYTVRGLLAYLMFSQIRTKKQVLNIFNNENKLLEQAIFYTEQHLNEPINVSKLAHALGVSHSTLTRTFKHLIGCNPLKFLTRYKIIQSVYWLRNGQNVGETAKALGYSSPFHFSNTFKLIMGHSPSSYLKQNR